MTQALAEGTFVRPETASQRLVDDDDRRGACSIASVEIAPGNQRDSHRLEEPRSDTVDAEIIGGGMAADAYHLTGTPPDGIGAVLGMEKALKDANITAVVRTRPFATGTTRFPNMMSLSFLE